MKLRKLHIEDYKMFKDFDISFVDDNDEALPIVVLAGVNGSGKTTLLEFMEKFDTTGYFDINGQYLDVEYNKVLYHVISANDSMNPNLYEYSFFSENIVYLPAGSDKIENIKETIRQKYIDRAFEIDKPSEALRELQLYINDIFTGLDLTFNLAQINYNEKEVLFEDGNENLFDISELSTGEKTLLSKVLYLYFKDYKNKVIVIDEPELSLHPSWQNKVLKIYENFALKNNCQIIIATHSPHIIGSAKNEYLRILRKNEEGNIEVVDNLMAYGRDIEWVLEEVMGTQYTRERKILEKIEACDTLINEEKFDEADNAIDALEAIIGEHDSAILTLRNSLAFERMDLEEDN